VFWSDPAVPALLNRNKKDNLPLPYSDYRRRDVWFVVNRIFCVGGACDRYTFIFLERQKMRSQGRGGSGRGRNGQTSMKSDLEVKTDELERRLKEKIDVMSGFGDAEMQARKLQQNFAYFDMNGSGTIDYQEFFAAMTKLNFVGVQKEIETLFNRYDEDASGDLNYKEFAYSLFGIGNKPTMDVNSRNIVEKVKARILEKDGASGIHKVARILSRMDHDGSKTLDQDELMEGLRVYGISRIPPSELQLLFNYFDRDRSGKISVEEFLRGLKVIHPPLYLPPSVT
jgi:Ca2+-binding EF-hand superfamily protein